MFRKKITPLAIEEVLQAAMQNKLFPVVGVTFVNPAPRREIGYVLDMAHGLVAGIKLMVNTSIILKDVALNGVWQNDNHRNVMIFLTEHFDIPSFVFSQSYSIEAIRVISGDVI